MASVPEGFELVEDALSGELGAIPNPFGGISTEKSITITDPRINQGRPTNIPQLVTGQSPESIQRILADQATREDQEIAITRAIQRMSEGQALPSFGSIDEAVSVARSRSDAGGSIDKFQANIPEGFELVGGPDVADRPIDSAGVDNAGAGIDQGVIQDVIDGFSQLPGVPELTEIAAGANRTVAGVLDFLGPDTINAVLNLTGSDKRVPTLTESIPGIKGGFVEPGLKREVLGAAGEIIPAAVGIGQLLRTLSQRLPALAAGPAAVAGESTGAGLLRQAGQTTAGADIGFGAVAGAGQELGGAAGEEIAGEPGRQAGELIGGITAPLAVIPLTAARSTASRLLRQAAPSADELRNTARGIYNSLDESGVRIPAINFDRLARDITRRLNREGADINLTPETNAVIRRLTAEMGADKTLTQIDTLRKVAQGAASSINSNERRLGSIAVNRIDDFLDDVGGEVIGGREAGQAFRSARDLWGRAKKSELLDQAVLNARDQASGFENGLRTQFRQILKRINTGKERGFTAEETTAIRRVVNGTNAGNIARFLGKFGILDGVTSRSLTTLGGAGLAGAVTGSTGVAAAVPLIGQVSGALAQRLTLNNSRMANAIVRAGRNGANIARIYSRNTPASQRNPEELAELLLANRVPVETLRLRNAPSLLADAAVIAAVARANDNKEE